MIRNAIRLTGMSICIAALTACGGGGGGGGGGTTAERAATSAIVAKLAAKAGQIAGNQSDGEQEKSLTTKQQNACEKGDLDTEPGSRASRYLPSSNISTERTIANNCRNSGSAGGFSFSSRQDGILEVGEAESGSVIFLRASDLNDDPSTGDPFIIETSSSSTSGPGNFNAEFQGVLEICDGCSSAVDGGTLELYGYYYNFLDLPDTPALTIVFGNGPAKPISIVATETASETSTEINGRFAFDDGECDVDTDYRTLSPIITENTSGMTTSGKLELTLNGEKVNVDFNSDGSATVDGQTFTPEDLAAIEDECASSLEAAEQS